MTAPADMPRGNAGTSVAHFGSLPDGRDVDVIRLDNGALRVDVLTLGAITHDVRLAGVAHALTLGSPDLLAYAGRMSSFNAVMGPVANRIGHARADIDGRTHRFEPKQPGGPVLHSGAAGVHRKVWEITDAAADRVILEIALADGDGGFPGNRHLTATYALDAASLTLALTAASDAPTLMNLAHHGYWTMDGAATWEGQRLTVSADRWLPTDAANVPTGEIAPVAGTVRDFRDGRVLTLGGMPKLDNTWCLSDGRTALRPVATLQGRSGVRMDLDTTEPGLQIFDMAPIDTGSVATHHGFHYGPKTALALEPQFWPDAPNHAAFPTILLRPGDDWHWQTRWRFSTA